MPDATTPPDLEVAEHIDGDAHRRAPGIEEDEVGEGGQGKGALGAEEYEDGDGEVREGPIEADALIATHAVPGLAQGWDGEGGRKDGRRARGRFLEDVMLSGDRAMLVSVAAALADVLRQTRQG